MKRFALLLIVAAAAAFAISYGLRQAATTSSTAVAALLPRGTILFVHLPDFNRARDEWHDSDIYKLYREPAVLAFLQRPLAKLPQHDAASETLHEVERLAPKSAFIGLTSTENNSPKIVAGFRFRGSQENAEKIIGKWRGQSLNNTSTAPRIVPPPGRVRPVADKIESQPWRPKKTFGRPSRTCHRVTPCSFMCSQKRSRRNSVCFRRNLVSNFRRISGRSSNKCAAFAEQRASTAEKSMTYFSSAWRGGPRMHRSLERPLASEPRTRFF